jgi:adenylate cyclase
MFETLGDTKAKQIISEVVLLMWQAVEGYQGRVIKTIGDEVMAEFPNPQQAALAASRMQIYLVKQNAATGRNVQIHVGFHHGEVIREGGDVFGDAVNVAARMVGQCRPGQILSTRETAQLMSPAMDDRMRSLGNRSLKGKQSEIEVYEILWQNDRSNLTVVSRGKPSVSNEVSATLHLRYQKNHIIIKQKDTPFLLGRETEDNLYQHLTVDDDCVSRVHSVIEYHKGQFRLNDRSTNGTWVYPAPQETLFIHQDSYLMGSAGAISLGKDMFMHNKHRIDFKVERKPKS